MRFNERKTAQIAAFFLNCEGRPMGLLKLMKLLYLAERESLQQYNMPLSGDRLVSMDQGPVLSHTLGLINNTSFEATDDVDGWYAWIGERGHQEIALAPRRVIDEAALDELSKADLDILQTVWEEFGHYDGWELRNRTHELLEWTDPQGTSLPISYNDVFRALGYTDDQTAELVDEIEDSVAIDKFFESL